MKNGLKFSFGIILGLLILLGVFLLGITAGQLNDFPGSKSSRSQVIIDQLKELKRLEVLQANLFAYKTFESGALLPLNNNEFVVFESGKAVYGLDLAKDITIKISNRDIELNLPDIEIFDLIVNPDSVDFIGIKKGLFTTQEDFENLKKDVMTELFAELKIKANNRDIINQARKNSELLLNSMLKTLGYEKITINFSGVKGDRPD
jgi:hypothetical protein